MKSLTVAVVLTLVASVASAQTRPANWNFMSPNDQATWTQLAPMTWLQMTDAQRVAWKDMLSGPEVQPSVPLSGPTCITDTTTGQITCYTPASTPYVTPVPTSESSCYTDIWDANQRAYHRTVVTCAQPMSKKQKWAVALGVAAVVGVGVACAISATGCAPVSPEALAAQAAAQRQQQLDDIQWKLEQIRMCQQYQVGC
jgi:hypothetical protein